MRLSGSQADTRRTCPLGASGREGTTQLLFEPNEFLEKLAALTPPPAINLLLYHGALAPHARWRAQVVGSGRTVAGDSDAGPRDAGGQRPHAPGPGPR